MEEDEIRGMDEDINWENLWKLKGPGRFQSCLWLARHNKLLTNSEKKRRHMHMSGLCDVCAIWPETTLHALRDCKWISDTGRSW